MQATTAARPRPGGGAAGWWSALGPTGGAAAALAVLVIANALFTPNFATAGNLENVLLQVSVTLLVAVGMTYVIATGGVDLSVGSVMAVSAAVAAVTVDYGLFIAIPLALLAGMAVGLLNGAFISYFGVQAIVVTLATLLAGRGLAQVINRGGALLTIDDPGFLFLGRGHLLGVPVQVLVAALVVALAIFVLRSTPFGRYVLAAGGNPAAARLAGVPVNRTVVSVYVISGLLAGMAGLVEASRLGASAAAKIGQGAELDAIAAVVVGGTLLSGGRATLAGTVVGALIMQVIATSFNMLLIPYAWALAFKALIILFAVYLQRPRRV
ncbi:MAG TPA: ABC transporter permease [Longimicrobium sp.]|jgi:ribose/xylose/arabinose/galactoside ABC-type transport system permease subunit|uniref:ABC transporter permease n=1 Tax=Longimicrobium sp. TaxID=2029185 RepID=UPI002ED85939